MGEPGPPSRSAVADRRRPGDRLVAALAEREGPVLSPFASWLPTYAGHPPSVHYMALWDLDDRGGVYRGRLDAVRGAIRDHRWPTAVLANEPFPYGLDDAYRVVDGTDGAPAFPRTGWHAGAKAVLTPRGGR